MCIYYICTWEVILLFVWFYRLWRVYVFLCTPCSFLLVPIQGGDALGGAAGKQGVV